MVDRFRFWEYNTLDFGVWRSLVSRLVRVQEASGSNPDTPTIMTAGFPAEMLKSRRFFYLFRSASPRGLCVDLPPLSRRPHHSGTPDFPWSARKTPERKKRRIYESFGRQRRFHSRSGSGPAGQSGSCFRKCVGGCSCPAVQRHVPEAHHPRSASPGTGKGLSRPRERSLPVRWHPCGLREGGCPANSGEKARFCTLWSQQRL